MENNIFKANPKLDCYYETSDGVPFYTDYAAKTHAQTLDDKTVTPVHRYAVKTVATEPVDAPVEEIPRDTEPTEPTDVPVESDERGELMRQRKKRHRIQNQPSQLTFRWKKHHRTRNRHKKNQNQKPKSNP
ncbi:hypothetical protein E5F92_009575 [Flavobacterium columnare]|uniref:hypothetical protein n=1 Tax=Flavobacterium columnare TaxID=996 RepID=UPI002989B169|nr:hypothetical protein [Flavobacterium columnare]MCH4832912.1 hypothetical protein [Flavobacterium columnare]